MPNAKRKEYVQHSDYASTDIDQFGESDAYGDSNRAGRGAKHQLHIQWVEYVWPDGRRELGFRLSSKTITSDEAKELYEADKHQPRHPVDQSEIVFPTGCFCHVHDQRLAAAYEAPGVCTDTWVTPNEKAA